MNLVMYLSMTKKQCNLVENITKSAIYRKTHLAIIVKWNTQRIK